MRSIGHIAAVLIVLFASAGVEGQPLARERTSLDAGWRFALGNAADPALAASVAPLCADPDPVVADAARWALARLRPAIGSPGAAT